MRGVIEGGIDKNANVCISNERGLVEGRRVRRWEIFLIVLVLFYSVGCECEPGILTVFILERGIVSGYPVLITWNGVLVFIWRLALTSLENPRRSRPR